MMAETAAAPALAVGDEVELLADLPTRKLRAGARGIVLVVDLPFGAVSVSFGGREDPTSHRPPRYFQIRPAHLRRVGHRALEGV